MACTCGGAVAGERGRAVWCSLHVFFNTSRPGVPATGRSPAHVRAPHTHTADRARPRHKVARIATATGAGRRCLSVTRCAGARAPRRRSRSRAAHTDLAAPARSLRLVTLRAEVCDGVPALREYVRGLPRLERPRLIPVVVLSSDIRPCTAKAAHTSLVLCWRQASAKRGEHRLRSRGRPSLPAPAHLRTCTTGAKSLR